MCSVITTIDALMAAHIGPLNTLNTILLLHYYTCTGAAKSDNYSVHLPRQPGDLGAGRIHTPQVVDESAVRAGGLRPGQARGRQAAVPHALHCETGTDALAPSVHSFFLSALARAVVFGVFDFLFARPHCVLAHWSVCE